MSLSNDFTYGWVADICSGLQRRLCWFPNPTPASNLSLKDIMGGAK